MDNGTIIIAAASFAFISTMAMVIHAHLHKFDKSSTNMIFPMIFLTISFGFMYFDIDRFTIEEPSFFFTFFTFLFLSLSVSFYVRAFKDMNHLEYNFSIWLIIIYAIVMSLLGALFTVNPNYYLRNVVYFIIMIFPEIFYLIRKWQTNRKEFFDIFVIETFIIFALFGVKFLNYAIFYPNITYTTIPESDKFITLGINLLLISQFFVYMLVKSYKDVVEIDQTHKLLQKAYEEVKLISEIDTLTGLYNRRKINEVLNEIEKDNDKLYSILIGDLDNFKEINDQYGHLEGDKVLVEVANTIKSIIRKDDIIGRWGGDELILVLANCTEKESLMLIERINHSLKELSKSSFKYEIIISFGYACVNDKINANEAIYEADQRMYNQKETNRNLNKD